MFKQSDYQRLRPIEQREICRMMERKAVLLYNLYVDKERLEKRREARTFRALAVHHELRYRKRFYKFLQELADPQTGSDANIESDIEEDEEEEIEADDTDASMQTVINTGSTRDENSSPMREEVSVPKKLQNRRQLNSQRATKQASKKDLNANSYISTDANNEDDDEDRDSDSPMQLKDLTNISFGRANITIVDHVVMNESDYGSDSDSDFENSRLVIDTNSDKFNYDIDSESVVTSTVENEPYTQGENETQSDSESDLWRCETPQIPQDEIFVPSTPCLESLQTMRAVVFEEEPVSMFEEDHEVLSLDFLTQEMAGKTSTQQ